ncbi:MAG: ligase-associated DNA damage response DEXH box helicase [Sphingomonadaceae bacterium]|nr:ligase-associated DNA damage response DEXH box helicase [Sphingomonadaceae bacterium]
MADPLPPRFTKWFAARGWTLRHHQAAMLDAAARGEHALLVAPTGAGKTLAGFLPELIRLAARGGQGLGISTLYISPLKALAADMQRNLLQPVNDMALPIRVETRTGDTGGEARRRQKSRPPDILLTTPESLSLMLADSDAAHVFAALDTIIIDEVHSFASTKRGDLLSLAMARLTALRPALRRVALSATIAEADKWCDWIAPDGAGDNVRLIEGEAGATPEIQILLPEARVPWAGHSGLYAVQAVMEVIAAHRTSIIFCNTRGLCELIFQALWKVNDKGLPIAIHHGSLSREARQRTEAAMAAGALRALIATSSVDLGLDWGDVDCVVQMGAPKGASRLIQRIGRANHRLDAPSKAFVVPGNRFEWLEARAAMDAIAAGERDATPFRPGSLDVLAQHITGCACAAPFGEAALLSEIRRAAPYKNLSDASFQRTIGFVRDGGYALSAYDRFHRLAPAGTDGDGSPMWRISSPAFVRQHRMNAGVIVEAPTIAVRFKNGRKLGEVEEYFASTLLAGDRFFFAGVALEVIGVVDNDLLVRATAKSAQIPSYSGTRIALTTQLAARVRMLIARPENWADFPADVRQWLRVQRRKSHLPAPEELLSEIFPHEGQFYWLLYPFEGWNAHQSLAMLLTRRMEAAGLQPLGFQASDYALAIWSAKPVSHPKSLLSNQILEDDFADWVEQSHLLKRAFRDVAVISGLIERQLPGKRKSARSVTFSTDLIYDVLMRYQSDHLLLEAAWADAAARLTDVGRLGDLLENAGARLVDKRLEQVSPFALPAMIEIGRENVTSKATEDSLIADAASDAPNEEAALIALAMADELP